MGAPLKQQHERLKAEYQAAKPRSGVRTFVQKQMSKVVLADLRRDGCRPRRRKAG
jgi:hypothetical protein